MDGEIDTKQYILPNDQPVICLEVENAFNNLTANEKLYAHHISKASWHGGLITLLQTSPESAPIFVFLHKLFRAQSPEDFKAQALKYNFTEDEVTALFVYACGIFSNAGNYKVSIKMLLNSHIFYITIYRDLETVNSFLTLIKIVWKKCLS